MCALAKHHQPGVGDVCDGLMRALAIHYIGVIMSSSETRKFDEDDAVNERCPALR